MRPRPSAVPASRGPHSQVKRYAASARIASEGDTGPGWFVLLSGRIGVFKGNLKIAEFARRGMVVGEISGILNRPRSADLVALEDTELVHVQANLDQLIAEHPQVVKKILVSLAERLARTTDALWIATEEERSAAPAAAAPAAKAPSSDSTFLQDERKTSGSGI